MAPLCRGYTHQVADLKNSVKDRSNAQSSCAGTFIGEHLHPEYQVTNPNPNPNPNTLTP